MVDPRVERYATLLLDTCLGVQPGWQVIVWGMPWARPLLEEITRQLGRRGAYPLLHLTFGGGLVYHRDWLRQPACLGACLAPQLLRDHGKRRRAVHELRRERHAPVRAPDRSSPRGDGRTRPPGCCGTHATRVCIVGASGKLGRYMVSHSLNRGHEVVGVCRSESVGKLDAFKERITVMPGSTKDREVIKRAVDECEGVLFVLVPRGVHGYIQRRLQEGKTRREATRCLKRYLARNLYRLLEHGPQLAT